MSDEERCFISGIKISSALNRAAELLSKVIDLPPEMRRGSTDSVIAAADIILANVQLELRTAECTTKAERVVARVAALRERLSRAKGIQEIKDEIELLQKVKSILVSD